MPHRIAYFMREDSWFLFLFTYISLLAIYKVSLHYSIMPFDVPDSNEITIIQLGGLTGLTIVWGVSLTSCLCRLVECRICIFERIFQLVMLLILALGISRDAIFLSKTFGQSSEDLKNAQQLFNKDLNSIFFHEKSSNNFSMDFDLPFLNRIQRQFKCCGARSFKDYDKSFDGVTYKVPVSCCKSLLLCKSGTVSYEDDESDLFGVLYTKGCNEALVEINLIKNKKIIILALISLLIYFFGFNLIIMETFGGDSKFRRFYKASKKCKLAQNFRKVEDKSDFGSTNMCAKNDFEFKRQIGEELIKYEKSLFKRKY